MDMPNSLLEVCPAPRILGGQCPESSSHRDPSSQSPAPRQGFEARPKASKKLGVSMFFLSEKVKRDEKSLCDHLFFCCFTDNQVGVDWSMPTSTVQLCHHTQTRSSSTLEAVIVAGRKQMW